jgi:transposase-like protein
MSAEHQRRLTAIMVADVVGYSRLMEQDEAGTLAALRDRRKAILEPTVRARGGRIVKVMGDGVLVEFSSAVNAVTSALELQRKMAEANEIKAGLMISDSLVPIRRRQRKMQGFKSAKSAQRFLSAHGPIYNTFNTCRHLISAANHRIFRREAMTIWREATCIAA